MIEKRLKNEYFLFVIALLVYLITAINSNGYHHPDEHFQIIEFAGLKAGWNTAADLTWEYDSNLRPSLQPMIALAIIKLCDVAGITNPYDQSMIMRIITGIGSLLCIGYFIRCFSKIIQPRFKNIFIFLSYFLWFLPAINVRFSSETLSGLSFLCATGLVWSLTRPTFKSYLFIGILLGLSFEFRFQMAIAATGMMGWLIFIKRIPMKQILTILLGGLSVVILCTCLDSWYYNKPVFVPYNYIYSAFSDTDQFGTHRWFFYIVHIISRPTPVIGIIILCSLFYLLKEYKSILFWCIFPFLLVHIFIPHKEVRFLYPLINFLPLIMILFIQKIIPEITSSVKQLIVYPIYIIFFIINIGGIIMLAFKPPMTGNVAMMEYIQNNYSSKPTHLFVIEGWSNPYSYLNIKGLNMRFYNNKMIKTIELRDNSQHHKIRNDLKDDDLILLRKDASERYLIEKLGYTIEKRSIPPWIEKMNPFYKVYNSNTALLLYSKKNKKKITL